MKSVASIIYEFATASGTGLYTLCGTRAWKWFLPPRTVFNNGSPGLVIQPLSEEGHVSGAALMPTVNILCYGGSASPTDAETVARAVYGRFHLASGSVSSGRILTCEWLNGYPAGPDNQDGWVWHVAQIRPTIEGV